MWLVGSRRRRRFYGGALTDAPVWERSSLGGKVASLAILGVVLAGLAVLTVLTLMGIMRLF